MSSPFSEEILIDKLAKLNSTQQSIESHVNHSIFWKNLAPVKEGGGGPPKGSLGSAIDTHFGSLEGLVKKMNAEDAAVQGSGWVWLGLDKELKKLVVDTTETSNEDPWANN